MVFLDFFYRLREDGFPVSLHEYLGLMEALKIGLAESNLDDFYYLSRSIFVKNEVWLDRYDEVFGSYFNGQELRANLLLANMDEEWLRAELKKILSPEEIAEIEKLGFDELIKRFKELLEKQENRHEGGNRMIGTGGSSPFGNSGFNPEGLKLGEGSGNRSGIRNWNMREFSGLRGDVEMNTRQLKMALRKLRILTREGRPDELDIDKTVRKTSENAGMLDISMRPQRKNRVKVILFMDAGGSMYEHVKVCERLFSAARHEFKNLEYFYFHNCIYDRVWRDNKRRFNDATPTMEVLAKYNRDYKCIILGDAAMAPYELHAKGGGYEYSNRETGVTWLKRVRAHFDYTVWLNPNADYGWHYFATTVAIRELFEKRMFPLTLDGLGKAMKALRDKQVTHDEVWVRA